MTNLAPGPDAVPTLGAGWAFDLAGAGSVPSVSSPYSFSLASPAFFSITDCCIPGDIYQVFEGATLILTTVIGPAPSGPFPPSVAEADADWASSVLSHGQTVLGAGAHSITVEDVDCVPFGCPAGFFTRLDPVPEPASLFLIGTGLAALAGTTWRARRRSR